MGISYQQLIEINTLTVRAMCCWKPRHRRNLDAKLRARAAKVILEDSPYQNAKRTEGHHSLDDEVDKLH